MPLLGINELEWVLERVPTIEEKKVTKATHKSLPDTLGLSLTQKRYDVVFCHVSQIPLFTTCLARMTTEAISATQNIRYIRSSRFLSLRKASVIKR
mmetsp:Transcript_10102/g.25278  ORF Transcript_10102/g.25278 Transcript_10102/m.25278 type:complete len:96 (+) Transcript_10102:2082-2369(+)